MTFPAPVLSVLRDLSALPYENLSKIVAYHREGAREAGRESAMALSADGLDRARRDGVGGTCFSLTWWLERRLRGMGFPCAFLLADKSRARNVHCGLRLDWEGRSYLLDPGYMIFEPVPLPGGGLASVLWVSPNEVRLEDAPALDVWRLWSGPRGQSKHRFDFRKSPAGQEEFLGAWEDSYALPMMAYPVLNRIREGTQYYLQKRSLLIRTPEGGRMRKLEEGELRLVLEGTFGIPGALAREALEVVLAMDHEFFRR